MTRRELTLSLLQQAGEEGVTTADFLEAGVGSRYGARLMELRKQGFLISATRLREGSWKYVLEGLAEGDRSLEPTRGLSVQPPVRQTPSPSASLFDLAPVSGTKSGTRSAITGRKL